MKLGDIFYRYENFGTSIQRVPYFVVKITPKGCRVATHESGLDWKGNPLKTHLILNDSNKKFACPESELNAAIESFFIRKRREYSHLIERFTVTDSILKNKKQIEDELKRGATFITSRVRLATNEDIETLLHIKEAQMQMGYRDEVQQAVYAHDPFRIDFN